MPIKPPANGSSNLLLKASHHQPLIVSPVCHNYSETCLRNLYLGSEQLIVELKLKECMLSGLVEDRKWLSDFLSYLIGDIKNKLTTKKKERKNSNLYVACLNI